MLLNYFYIISGLLFVVLLLGHGFYTKKQKDNIKISNYVAVMGFSLAFYVVFGLILSVFSKSHLIMLLFALSPFIIGRFATYKTKNLFASVQIICILISVLFVGGSLW